MDIPWEWRSFGEDTLTAGVGGGFRAEVPANEIWRLRHIRLTYASVTPRAFIAQINGDPDIFPASFALARLNKSPQLLATGEWQYPNFDPRVAESNNAVNLFVGFTYPGSPGSPGNVRIS